jgi:TonB-dependent SusC/RagA subfamily outer membrane receptor
LLRPSVLKMLGLFAAAALVAAMPLSAQSGGTVTGRVTAAETAQPLGAVQVFLDGTGRGSITRADGSFTINEVPPGTYTIVAQSIGYQQVRRPGVQVTPGATATVNLELPTNVLALQEIVVTGLVDPVEGARSPITVAQVTREQMPVPVAGSAASAIQGKVAGASMTRTTGLPGSEVQINLRTPTSARGSNQPLMVVDGVILGSSTVDIESMDIESVEVIKGAAAASLYGSRAAAGVIAITTVRGRGLAAGQTQFSTRAEFGSSFAPRLGGGPLPTTHAYLTNEQGQLINNAGQPVAWGQRVLPPVAFMDKQYTVPVYDNLRTAYRPGDYNTQNFSITSNHENTNLAIALNRYKEQGALEGHRGYDRNSFRVNLDHRFRNTLTLGISGYHARAYRDELISGTGGLVGGLLG